MMMMMRREDFCKRGGGLLPTGLDEKAGERRVKELGDCFAI